MGRYHRIFIHDTDAYIQRPGGAFRVDRNRKACIHIQVIDGIRVICFHFRVFGKISRCVGYHGNRGAFHPVSVHIIAGFKRYLFTACDNAGQVKARHGLPCVSSHSEIAGINGIFLITGVAYFVLFLIIVPFGGRCRNSSCCYPAYLVGSAGKAGSNPGLLPDSHGCRAAELSHIGVIRRMDGHIAAGVR